jgi:hypothetical protein
MKRLGFELARKPVCEVLHATEELRSRLRLIGLDFLRLLHFLWPMPDCY